MTKYFSFVVKMMTKNNFNWFILQADCTNPKIYDLLPETYTVETTLEDNFAYLYQYFFPNCFKNDTSKEILSIIYNSNSGFTGSFPRFLGRSNFA